MENTNVTRNLEEYVSSMLGVSTTLVFSKSRKSPAVTARTICMAAMRDFTKASYADIGEYFNRDHSTAIFSIKKAKYFYGHEDNFRKRMDMVYERCYTKSLTLPFPYDDVVVDTTANTYPMEEDILNYYHE